MFKWESYIRKKTKEWPNIKPETSNVTDLNHLLGKNIILERINTALKEMGEYNNYYIVVKTSQVGKALKQQKMYVYRLLIFFENRLVIKKRTAYKS